MVCKFCLTKCTYLKVNFYLCYIQKSVKRGFYFETIDCRSLFNTLIPCGIQMVHHRYISIQIIGTDVYGNVFRLRMNVNT